MADFSQAMIVGNGDYSGAATSEVIRIFAKYPARQQYALVQLHAGFAKQPALWYVAARAAYRDFDYALAGEIATHGLNALNVPADSLPQTTDPDRIAAGIKKFNPDLAVDFECSRTALCERGFKGNFAVSGLFELGGHATAGCPL